VKKVLIVEDQADIRELIRVTLEFEDYELHEAANGNDGLAAAINLKPDLILLDVMMPGGMDGLEVCKRVRANSALKKTKVVILSAKGQQSDKAAGLSVGANEYLIKPFSPLDLMKVVSRMIG
jgi:DNA-binding response OmpR family regulator